MKNLIPYLASKVLQINQRVGRGAGSTPPNSIKNYPKVPFFNVRDVNSPKIKLYLNGPSLPLFVVLLVQSHHAQPAWCRHHTQSLCGAGNRTAPYDFAIALRTGLYKSLESE
jgi:hypothetical protein